MGVLQTSFRRFGIQVASHRATIARGRVLGYERANQLSNPSRSLSATSPPLRHQVTKICLDNVCLLQLRLIVRRSNAHDFHYIV